MIHFFAQRFLSAYLDNALSERRETAIGKHVEKCSRCKEMLSAMKNASFLIRSAREQMESAPYIQGERITHRPPLKVWHGWAAALVLFVFAGFLLWDRSNHAIDPQGAVYLDLLLQEAVYPGNSPALSTTPYKAVAQTPAEFVQLTGSASGEPNLPSGFRFQRGFIYNQIYGGGIGRVYVSNDGRVLCLFEQSIETKMAYGAGNSEIQKFLGRDCIEVVWPSLRLLSCESGQKRILLLSNVSTSQLESAFLHYPGLQLNHQE